MKPSSRMFTGLALGAGLSIALSACTPWHAKQGFEDRQALYTPEGQARMVELVKAGGYDGHYAAYHLANADAETIAPVMPELIRIYASDCRVEEGIAEGDDDWVHSTSCDPLINTAAKVGAASVPELAKVNPYAASLGLGALGTEGASGLPTLVSALGSEFPTVRRAAIDALRNIAVPEARVLLALENVSQNDANDQVRDAAARALLSLSAQRDIAQPDSPNPRPERPGSNAPSVVTRPDDIALVIGVEDYRGGLPSSTGARADARAFADLAETHLGLPRRNIITLLDDQATRSSLEAYFQEWLPKNAKSTGRVYVFFAGHGAPDPQTGDAYLVPWDGDPRFINRQGMGIDELTSQLRELSASEVIVMLDSCFSGSGGRSVLAEGTRPLVPVKDLEIPARDDQPARFALLSAAAADEVTGTMSGTEHGLFSYFLIEGLSGQADANGDGVVELGEISTYLSGRVPDEARRDNRDQTPTAHFEPQSIARMPVVTFEADAH
ncbi:hypothetical protein EA187_15850 [Lujinxingia sediminis]|uniref:Peptidase C14 caspase domain-containing protein n=1 Tax=Lujinxingia sediminis TaxID=2480984 RepID=A0ABY0CQM5_9DELT|nr:caspase family protein [Lujinxingia sediminis]RVU42660.1 hypothetical protein EA187_15850 [Lujinxingia sediminis]